MDDPSNNSEKSVVWALAVSILFFMVYFMIHWIINIYTGSPPYRWAINPKEMIGPFTISLCSSLLIFSLGCFLARGMKHLSLVVPDAFFKAYTIFIVGQVLIQIAGHAEIISISAGSHIPGVLKSLIYALSVISVPVTFISLLWLELYQSYIYDFLHDRLPDVALSGHPSPLITTGCTIFSIVTSIIKHFLHGYEWVFLIEIVLAAIVVGNTLVAGRNPSKHSEESS